MRRFVPLSLIVALALACSSSPSAENALADAAVGTWIGERIGLLASADYVLLSVPCIAVVFPAIAPASDGSFELLGTVADSVAGGVVNGRPARLTGRLLVDSLQVDFAINMDGVWPEPINRVLTRNDSANFVVDATCIQ